MTRALLRLAILVVCLGLAACAGLLGIKPKTVGNQPFEHRAHVLKGVSCLECHSGITSAGDVGPLHLPDSATCTKCHEKPHDTRDCNGCHGSVHTRQRAELAREHLKFEHRGHVLAANGECVRCHIAAGEPRAESLSPPMAACLGCHHHDKQFVVRDCEGCHVDLPAERIKPESHAVHEGDFVREHGVRAAGARDLCNTCHSERFCSSCHGVTVPALPARLAFDKPAIAGLHRAGFKSRHKEEARGQPGLCTTCHSEDSCRACHSREGVSATGKPGTSPHPRGWLTPGKGGGDHGMQARIDPASCASCHGGAGEQLCVGCHKVGGPGGSVHGPGFSSIKSKTRDVPCRLCHVPSP